MAPLYESCPNLRMETMYNTTCMAAKMALSSKVSEKQPDVCFQCFVIQTCIQYGNTLFDETWIKKFWK